MASNPSAFPCGLTCLPNCLISSKMGALQASLIAVGDDGSAQLVRTFLASYKQLCLSPDYRTAPYTPNIALPALFDFLMSAKYAKRMVADGGWTYCSGANTNETPTLFFPFLKTCPRCSVKRGIKPSVKANKPQSDLIGEMAVDSTILVLAALLHSIDPRVVVQKSNVRQGDVDMVIYDNDMIVLGEVKSSPLVVYPLEIQLARPMTEVIDGQPSSKPDHSKATTQVDMGNIALYIPHIDLHIPLGPYDGQWPYPRLIEFVRDPQNVAVLISAWNDLYETYVAPRQGKRGRQDEEHLRWLRCGCGGGVDDSKNAPGLDRTDDIKKGTYQVLKFGTYYKEQCPKRLIRTALVSNFFITHGYDRYLAEMEDVIWTKDKYSVDLDEVAYATRIRAFQADSVFNLYDAVLCLNRSLYRDERLREISSLDNFAARLYQ